MMADSLRCVERSIRIYAALVKAYPASFRKEYADEMVLVFRDVATEAWRRRRHIGLLVVWLRVLGDLIRTAPKERFIACITYKGGFTVGIKSLLTREIFPVSNFSHKAQFRWLLILFVPYGLLIGGIAIGKFMSMNLTEPQRFLGILLVVALGLQSIGGVLLSMLRPKNHSRYYGSVGQIALYTASVLAVVFGVWKLGSMAITEYELMLGILLLFQVMMGGCLLAEILQVIRTASADNADNAFPTQ
jgi:hypothetical protein